ncbi:hypothetical protein TELCIR_05743 [Teladorsagia circumcincta]|uniref:Uncharacterized protein n=1 Tax=Teladorsagia circumcincta TaxID=45464 RepID=A0A2G9UPW3_TELCI|nr:hypothetical protein TELCIR_05743 [Teladorsagia circumcincta]
MDVHLRASTKGSMVGITRQDVETPRRFMVQIYAWSSVCALGAMYDEDIRYMDPLNDGDVRFVSFAFSVVQSLFVGRAIRNVYLSAQPPLFITPAAIAVCYAVHMKIVWQIADNFY